MMVARGGSASHAAGGPYVTVLYAAIPFLVFTVVFAVAWLFLRHLMPPIFLGLRNAVRRLTLAIIGNRLEPWHVYLPLAAIMVGGLLVSLLAGGVFLELAEEMTARSQTIENADSAVHDWFRAQRREPLTVFFTTFTALATPLGLTIIVTIVSAVLLFFGRYRWMLYLVITASGGGILSRALKAYFSRARPDLSEALWQATGYSFPSGHAVGSVVVFGALAYVTVRALATWNGRSAALALAITTIAAVSASRLYLGVHWISDIAAGIFAGTLWLTATTASYEVLRRFMKLRARFGLTLPQ